MGSVKLVNERSLLLERDTGPCVRSRGWKRAFVLSFCAILGVLLVLLVVQGVCYVRPRVGDAVGQGVELDVQDVQFEGLQDQKPGKEQEGGLLFAITAQHHNHFEAVEDSTVRTWFTWVGGLARGVQLRIRSLDLQFVNEKGDLEDLGAFQVDPFYVNTYNNATTALNLNVVFWPDADGLGKVLQRFMRNSNATVQVKGDALVEIWAGKGYVGVGHVVVPVDVEVGGDTVALLGVMPQA